VLELQMKKSSSKKWGVVASPRQRASAQFLTKNSMIQLLHPPYSPDLAPCYFFLFPRMKKVLNRKRFADVEEVKKKTTEALKGITLQEFQDCFEKWKTLLDTCIASNRQYFEGDSICNT
jgi:transposase